MTEKDFIFAKDGSAEQKLVILKSMMKIKKNVTMIGDFTDSGPRLFKEKVAGNICGCKPRTVSNEQREQARQRMAN